jgi:hypothetical protein
MYVNIPCTKFVSFFGILRLPEKLKNDRFPFLVNYNLRRVRELKMGRGRDGEKEGGEEGRRGRRKEGGGKEEGRKEGRKEGRRAGGKEGRREGGKEGRREGGRDTYKSWKKNQEPLPPPPNTFG